MSDRLSLRSAKSATPSRLPDKSTHRGRSSSARELESLPRVSRRVTKLDARMVAENVKGVSSVLLVPRSSPLSIWGPPFRKVSDACSAHSDDLGEVRLERVGLRSERKLARLWVNGCRRRSRRGRGSSLEDGVGGREGRTEEQGREKSQHLRGVRTTREREKEKECGG